MGRRYVQFEGDDNSAVAASLTASDALLFTTMCIIGLPVDVHVKDGSVYSGIFHTAHVENDYAIVLKKARMIKKGICDANVSSGSLIETLIVQSEDLVQVVAKGIRLPENGITGSVGGNGVEPLARNDEGPVSMAEAARQNDFNVDGKRKSEKRFSDKAENGIANNFVATLANNSSSLLDKQNEGSAMDIWENKETCTVSASGRQVGDSLMEKLSDQKHRRQYEKINHAVQGSSKDMAKNDQSQGRPTSNDTTCADALSNSVSASPTTISGTSVEPCSSISQSSTPSLTPKSSNLNKTAKESKLNPGAKLFSPSALHNRSATPPVVPTGAAVAYIPDPYSMVPITAMQPDVDMNQLASRASMPVKFAPYNVVIGNGGNDAPYAQSIVGHMVSRTQPVRYANQYHNVQPGPAYVHPNTQNVMVGRVGPLVCMHPISNDVIQSPMGFSQVNTQPLLNPHQIQIPKNQGIATPQAVPLCVTPPIMASTQQFAMPSHIPMSQPFFPVVRPIQVPGSNGLLSSKFA